MQIVYHVNDVEQTLRKSAEKMNETGGYIYIWLSEVWTGARLDRRGSKWTIIHST